METEQTPEAVVATKFVAFEGMDGAGKDIQLEFAQDVYREEPVLFTREPGSPHHPLTQELRKHVLGKKLSDFESLLIFSTDRAIHLREVVMPALQAGKHVITNRSDASTVAFQCCGEGRQDLLSQVSRCREEFRAAGLRLPDVYIIFDLPAHVARERAHKRATQLDHFEQRPLEYYENVRTGYKSFAEMMRATGEAEVYFIDAVRSIEEVRVETEHLLARILRR